MNYEYRGRTLREALSKSLSHEHAIHMRKSSLCRQGLEHKDLFDVWAPPLFWGPWIRLNFIFSDDKPVNTTVSYQSQSMAKSSFDVEITTARGQMSRHVGPGSTSIVIPPDTATQLRIRAKSHSFGQHIRVTMQ